MQGDVPASDLGDLQELLDDEMRQVVAWVAGVEVDVDRPRLRLELRIVDYSRAETTRIIECHDVVDWTLTHGVIYSAALHDDHPALLPYNETQGTLYFVGAIPDPDATAAAAAASWTRIAGRFVDLASASNQLLGSRGALLRSGRGQVASGPITLLQAIAEALEAGGARTTILPTKGPGAAYDRSLSEWVNVPSDVSVLVLDGSWVVARSFHCLAA